MKRGATVLLTLTLLSAYAEGRNCFRGQPWPACRTFWITEIGAYGRFDPPLYPPDPDFKLYINAELGLMYNVGMVHAFGGTLFAGWDLRIEEDKRIGIKGRYRRWLTPEVSIDGGLGLLRSLLKNTPIFPCASVSVNYRDRIILAGQVEIHAWTNSPNNWGDMKPAGADLAWYGGLRFGSGCSLIAAAVATVTIAAILIGLGSGSG